MLDEEKGKQLRDEALKRVEENAHEVWKTAARDALERICKEKQFYTSDDLAERMGDHRPREPRAFGAMVLHAQRKGWAISTGRHVPSNQPRTHRSPRTVWKSLIYEGPPQGTETDLIAITEYEFPANGAGVRATGITVEMVDAITDEQWDQITDGKGVSMRGWLRKRMKRAIRLLTEGRIYDTDPDGRTLAAKKRA